MRSNELVYRALVDAALDDRRSWSSASDLAYEAGIPESSTYLAIARAADIGAIERFPGGGFAAVSVDKLTTLLCAGRSLIKDTLMTTTRQAAEWLAATPHIETAWGGMDAAAHHLHTHVADFSQGLLYVDPSKLPGDIPGEGDVRLIALDKRGQRLWMGYSSLAQTMADVFATPGWAASEYRYALRDRFFRAREWDQEGRYA